MKKFRARIQETLGHEGFRKYFNNTGWLFFGRVFSLGASFVVGIYIARYLGPAGYGELNYVISFVGLFGFLASFGIDSIASREMTRHPENKDTIIGTAFFLKIAGAVGAIVSILLFSRFVVTDSSVFLLIALFSITYIPQAFNIIEIYFQSQVLSRKAVGVQVIATIIVTIAKVAGVMIGASLVWFLLAYVLEAMIVALGLLTVFRTYGNKLRTWRFNRSISISLLKDSWPLMLSGAAIGIYTRIDQVMINAMLGDTANGLYAAGAKLSELWNFIPMLLCVSLAPAIINARNSTVFENRLRRLYVLMLLLSVGIALCTTLIAVPLVGVLFGTAYLEAVPVLQIYVWASISVFLGVAFGQYLLVKNYTKIAFYATVFGAVANVALNLALIPLYGIEGAAISTLISYTIATFSIFLFKEPRAHGMRVIQDIISRAKNESHA